MQYVNDELKKVLTQRLKLGEYAKPVCRVEVDRLAFIPGRTEDVSFVTYEAKKAVTLQQTFIAEGSDGQTLVNYHAITPPVPARGTFTSDDITSKYGMRNGTMHTGLDIVAAVGEDVVAAWSGRVSATSQSSPYLSYGYYVDIQHDNGIMTRYGHLSRVMVKEGDVVQQGETIALSGNTGYVMSGGLDVTGSYDDPTSDRSTGKGAHLHFEIRVNNNPRDPQPYLEGTSKLFTSSSNVGGGVTNGATINGSIGTQVYNQPFDDKQWSVSTGIKDISTDASNLGSVQILQTPTYGSFLVYDFVKREFASSPKACSFKIAFESAKDCVLKVGYFCTATEGLEFKVYFNDQLQVQIKKFNGDTNVESVEDVPFPAGVYDIKIEALWYGGVTCKFGLNYVIINEVNGAVDQGNAADADPTKKNGYTQTKEITSLIFNEVKKETQLQVGQFVYMDTLVLDNVVSVDIDDQYEMESREARIVVSNLNGFYSPEYNPFYFPEMYQQSPWSYFINGFHVGVLSENTPIRIYLGYGLNPMRVFTGLIDKVDGNAEDHQLSIACRDMYKKVMNYVLLKDKAYPKVNLLAGKTTASGVTDAGTGGGDYNGPRFDEIVAKAKYYANHPNFKGTPIDYLFLLAIAKHETDFGTTGAGRESSGSYILGYGVYDSSSKETAYAGIDRQLYYGAKRYMDALKSRNWIVDSLDDTTYFWSGGDKGAYQWAQDTNWPNPVWSIYQGYKADPSPFVSIPAYTPTGLQSIGASGTGDEKKTAWLKSAVVTDLIITAGMTGWRQAPSDIYYPDYVIEESYLVSANQSTGKVIRAIPNKEGEFEEVDIEAVMSPNGWLNPYIEEFGKQFLAFESKAGDAISDIIKDTHYRSYCDRYGTYRLEMLDMDRPISTQFTEYENLVSITKSTDWSRGRSHLAVFDNQGEYQNFVDTEILMELKGEVRTAVLNVPYAKNEAQKRKIAERFFFDIKRLCRTLQVSVPGNPALDVMDRVYVSDRNTTTRSVYTIKGIKSSFSVDNGYLQVIDLMWSNGEGAIL